MLNETRRQLEQIARDTGRDSYALLLLSARWSDAAGQSRPLIVHYASVAAEEDDEG